MGKKLFGFMLNRFGLLWCMAFVLLSVMPIVSRISFADTVVIQPGSDDGTDVWITNVYSYDDDYGVNDYRLRVGGWGDNYYSLIKFDLSSLPSNATSAKVYLYPFSEGDSTTSMYLDRVTSTWDESTGWYNGKPSYVNIGTISAPTVGNWYSIDVTDLYNAWKNGTYQNSLVQIQFLLRRQFPHRLIP